MSVLIWAQTVSKSYQQTTKVATSKEKSYWLTRILTYPFYTLIRFVKGTESKAKNINPDQIAPSVC